jgi:3-hydroxybutyryl-CoA dehydrogenase
MEDRTTVGVLGSGTMGHGIAQLMATRGKTVFLVDSARKSLQTAEAQIKDNFAYMVELGYLTTAEAEAAAGPISYGTEMQEMMARASYITEAISENLDLKKEVFQALDKGTADSVILCSNTSSYDINEIAEKVVRKERVIGTHWFHPPQITPCVEVIPGKTTSKKVIAETCALLESIGKAPTLCKSAPGFVANRIQYALVSESLAIVSEGLATPEEVDRIVKTSFGFRLSAFGPFEVCDQAGLDVYNTIFKYFHKIFKRDVFKTPPILEEMVGKGRFGLKNGKGFYEYSSDAAARIRRERDRKLYARLAIFAQENKKTQD